MKNKNKAQYYHEWNGQMENRMKEVQSDFKQYYQKVMRNTLKNLDKSDVTSQAFLTSDQPEEYIYSLNQDKKKNQYQKAYSRGKEFIKLKQQEIKRGLYQNKQKHPVISPLSITDQASSIYSNEYVPVRSIRSSQSAKKKEFKHDCQLKQEVNDSYNISEDLRVLSSHSFHGPKTSIFNKQNRPSTVASNIRKRVFSAKRKSWNITNSSILGAKMRVHVSSVLDERRQTSKMKPRNKRNISIMSTKQNDNKISFGYEGNKDNDIQYVHLMTEWIRLKESIVKNIKSASQNDQNTILSQLQIEGIPPSTIKKSELVKLGSYIDFIQEIRQITNTIESLIQERIGIIKYLTNNIKIGVSAQIFEQRLVPKFKQIRHITILIVGSIKKWRKMLGDKNLDYWYKGKPYSQHLQEDTSQFIFLSAYFKKLQIFLHDFVFFVPKSEAQILSELQSLLGTDRGLSLAEVNYYDKICKVLNNLNSTDEIKIKKATNFINEEKSSKQLSFMNQFRKWNQGTKKEELQPLFNNNDTVQSQLEEIPQVETQLEETQQEETQQSQQDGIKPLLDDTEKARSYSLKDGGQMFNTSIMGESFD